MTLRLLATYGTLQLYIATKIPIRITGVLNHLTTQNHLLVIMLMPLIDTDLQQYSWSGMKNDIP